MSKAEFLEEISKLTPEERDEIWDVLWTLEERHLLGASAPSDYEKAVLDREMEDFEKTPWVGTPWEEVEAREADRYHRSSCRTGFRESTAVV